MLELYIEGKDLWDEAKEEFYPIKGYNLKLEHSLVSISKWEAKYKKSFLYTEDKTPEELLDYVAMMNIGEPPEDPLVYRLITPAQVDMINKYINDPMTATTFSKEEEKEAEGTSRSKFVTSEEIYYWMTTQNIPFECQYWHLNRLITLIKICAIENKPEDKKNKKLTQSDLVARRARMDAARKNWNKH